MPINPCPLYGEHQMVSQGPCSVRNNENDNVISYLDIWCKCNCGEEFICEGRPMWNPPNPIEHYCHSIAKKQRLDAAWWFWVEPERIYYTSNSYLEGFDFT